MLTIFIVGVLIGFNLTASCDYKSTIQEESKDSQRSENKSREKSVRVQPTKQNKGKRCESRVYTNVGRDVDYNPSCYELQKKLIDAARKGNLEGMNEALKNGANVDGTLHDSYPALHTAAANGQSDAVRLLLDNGAQVNRVADFQNTPLNSAAAHGHLDVVEVLLESGADVCFKSSAGMAGDIAQVKGYKKLTELLKTAESTKCK